MAEGEAPGRAPAAADHPVPAARRQRRAPRRHRLRARAHAATARRPILRGLRARARPRHQHAQVLVRGLLSFPCCLFFCTMIALYDTA